MSNSSKDVQVQFNRTLHPYPVRLDPTVKSYFSFNTGKSWNNPFYDKSAVRA